jgi:hypothetical protein
MQGPRYVVNDVVLCREVVEHACNLARPATGCIIPTIELDKDHRSGQKRSSTT